MPEIVNLSDTGRAAFTRGFWKGMAAPLMLFSVFDLPTHAAPPNFSELPKRDSGNQAADWIKVGDQLRAAAKKDRESGGE